MAVVSVLSAADGRLLRCNDLPIWAPQSKQLPRRTYGLGTVLKPFPDEAYIFENVYDVEFMAMHVLWQIRIDCGQNFYF